MAKIAFLLLCHKDPEAIIAQAAAADGRRRLRRDPLRRPCRRADYDRIRAALASNLAVTFARAAGQMRLGRMEPGRRRRCEAARAAVEAFPRRHAFLPAFRRLHADQDGRIRRTPFWTGRHADYIESVDFFDSDWIKTGIKEERLIYRHFVQRTHAQAAVLCLDATSRGGLGSRAQDPARPPDQIGSQWWCLRRAHGRGDPGLPRHAGRTSRASFRTTWIPDETFFQTLVAPSRARGGNRQPHPDLPDVHRLRDAGHLLQRPLRPSARSGLSLRPQDLARCEATEGAARGALRRTGVQFAISNEGRSLYPS